MNIRIIGAGFVGIPTGVALAMRKHEVHLVDTDAGRVESLNRSDAPFHEPGLDAALWSCSGRMRAHRGVQGQYCTPDTDATILAVATPTNGNGDQDSFGLIRAASAWARDAVASAPNSDHLVIVKSTVLPGTCGDIQRHLRRDLDRVWVAHVPEFLAEGTALNDAVRPSRVVMTPTCRRGLKRS